MAEVTIEFSITKTTRYRWQADHSDLPMKIYWDLDESDTSDWADQISDYMTHDRLRELAQRSDSSVNEVEYDSDLDSVEVEPLDDDDQDDDEDKDDPPVITPENVPTGRGSPRPF